MVGHLRSRTQARWSQSVLLTLTAAGLLSLVTASSTAQGIPGYVYTKQAGPHLKINGEEFRFAGTNNYYLPYKSQAMVDDVLADAKAAGFTVMRTWAGFETGALDGSLSTFGKADGVVYFQYWNGSAPAYNDGPDGLQHLDYVVFKAKQLGIRLVLPFVNNWSAFGGMDQYVTWAGLAYHDDFYTSATVKAWYKAWISHLLNRVNPLTGIAYKDEPAIMMWELANEPRCRGDFPSSGNCTTAVLTGWADEMSRYVKSLDHKHLVGVGDEGFFCEPGSANWIDNCPDGVDSAALSSLDQVDVVSYHLYPGHWGQTNEWGTEYIERHVELGLTIGKPSILGEFGVSNPATRTPVYQQWTDTLFALGGNGALSWMLAGAQDDGSLYPDYDKFTIYYPSPTCTALSNFGAMMARDQSLTFPPVADDDIAEVMAGKSVTLAAASNDIAYGATIVPSSIVVSQPTGGSFVPTADGSIVFTPSANFAGLAKATYVISDSLGRTSAPARLSVTVNPDPSAPLTLFSFDEGTEGWNGMGGQAVSSSDQHVTGGTHSLMLPAIEGWYGRNLAQALNLGERTIMEWDLYSDTGTSQQLVLQTGESWSWCQMGGWGWVNGGAPARMSFDLKNLVCDDGAAPALNNVRAIWIFAGNGGSPVYIDSLQVKPDPGAPPVTVLHSFETGTEGFSGTVAQSTEWSSDGAASLQATGAQWFETVYATPLDFSGKTQIAWDIKTTDFGTSQQLVLRLGPEWAWCEGGGWAWVNPGSVTTMSVDLAAVSASCGASLAEVHGIGIYMANGGGPVLIDRIRLQ